MHNFFLPGALLHVLAIAVAAFFILFAASKAEGFVRFLGNLLGWILLLGAILFLAVAVYTVTTGQHPPWFDRFHGGEMMRGNEQPGSQPPGAPSSQPEPTRPQ